MNLLTWNLNHRTRPRKTGPAVAKAVATLAPDLVVFTEYVPGPQHQEFLAALKAAGVPYSVQSPFASGENHVLVASRFELAEGAIRAPAIAPSVPSNVLHVFVLDKGFELIGLRIPDYSRQPQLRRACWDWIQGISHSVVERPFLLVGDFNTDPRYPRSRCGDRIAALVGDGWRHAAPDNGGSYWTPQGHEVAIDHAFVSADFQVRSAKYVQEVNGTRLARGPRAISDHAALLVELSCPPTTL